MYEVLLHRTQQKFLDVEPEQLHAEGIKIKKESNQMETSSGTKIFTSG